jgi:hypothetical protein
MESDFYFKSVKLCESLTNISERHLSLPEILSLNREVRTKEFVGSLKTAQDRHTPLLDFSLKYSDLELVLSELVKNPEGRLRDILMLLLKRYAGKKLFKINWAMLQKDYRNKGLLDSMKVLCVHMKESLEIENSRSLFNRMETVSGDSFLNQTHEALVNEGGLLKEFFDKYGVISEYSFGMDLIRKFFSKCCKNDFLNNITIFLEVLSVYKNEDTFSVIENYLEKFDVNEYDFCISRMLLEKYGKPVGNDDLWAYISDETRSKYNHWLKILQMEDHFGRASRESGFWRQYYGEIKNIHRDEKNNLLFINFGDFAVVDFGKQNHETFLYKKEVFDLKYQQYLKEGELSENGWETVPDAVVTARTAFLEDASSNIYKMNYDGVGILYLKELLKRESEKAVLV